MPSGFVQTRIRKKKSLIFRWTAIGFEYGRHSPWRPFDELLRHLLPSRVALMVRQDLALMLGGSGSPSRSQRDIGLIRVDPRSIICLVMLMAT